MNTEIQQGGRKVVVAERRGDVSMYARSAVLYVRGGILYMRTSVL